LVFRAELRRRWRAWLVLAVLVGLVGGLVLAATAAGRRTDDAFPSFVKAHGYDALVYAIKPSPELAKLPGVASLTKVVAPINGQPTCSCGREINTPDFGVSAIPADKLPPLGTLIAGHMPAASDPSQVVASLSLLQDENVRIGTVFHVPFYAPSQLRDYFGTGGAQLVAKGPTLMFRVVGIYVTETDFPSGIAPSYGLTGAAALARELTERTATAYAYLIRLKSAAVIPGFLATINSLGSSDVAGYELETTAAASVQASIRPQAVGWWILALLAALVGLAVIGQALSRQSAVESDEYPSLVAIGLTKRELVTLGILRNLAIGLIGAAGAVALATALSPLTPVGEARNAVTSTGVNFDALILLTGALATVIVVIMLGIWPAIRATRTSRSSDLSSVSRPSVIVGQLSAWGAPATAVIGIRNALQRGRGRASVPVRTALFGTMLAVAALSATTVFGASLSHLTTTPRLYGDDFQLNFNENALSPSALRALEHNPAIGGITRGMGDEITINKVAIAGLAVTSLHGPVLISASEGHLPNGNGQLGLGETTLHQIGARVGSTVEVALSLPSGGTRTVPFRVVSRITFPIVGEIGGLGSGALFTLGAYESAACPPGPTRTRCIAAVLANSNSGYLASVNPGPAQQATITHFLDEYQSGVTLGITPTSLVNFGEAVNFPLIFGLALAGFGIATLLHLLVSSVSRRRREIGLLKALGFVNRQVAATVLWQATTLALIGIVVGVPVGVAIGRELWTVFATNLGAIPVAVIKGSLVAILAAAVLVISGLLAIVPALSATRSKPGELLRTL
jgi:hypothetical protein